MKQGLLGWFVLAALALGCGGDDSAPRELVVETDSGPVEGYEDEGVFSYRGIPYAAPPVGELRWKPPVEAEPWTETLSVTERPNGCMQEAFGGLPIPGFVASEDCLYLNVDTPTEGKNLPVMVWIHGGGFTLGEGVQADGGTAGDRIARETNTVVVSMNYRLGQFGFLAHSELTEESPDNASGNYGLMDQTTALKWVQRNIGRFGGDPNNVTIFGESAGAFSVCSHLVSPASAGLFHKAIVQSGSCERPWPTLAAAEAQGDEFAEALGCTGETVLGCMRDEPAADVLETLPQPPNFGFSPSEGATGSWSPILDGSFFTEQPSDSFTSGNFSRVPTIAGFTKHEARLFVWLRELLLGESIQAEDYVEEIAHLLGGNTDLAAEAAMEYPLEDYSEPGEALAAVATDIIFRCPGKQEIAKISAFAPAYLYQFEYPNGHSQLEILVTLGFLEGELPSYGLDAFHGADIPYVFGYSPILGIDPSDGFSTFLNEWNPGSVDEILWLDMIGYFSRFAASADPNVDGLTEWADYDPESDRHLVFDEAITVGTNAAEKCSFWADKDYLVAELGN